jgi:putative membrane protein
MKRETENTILLLVGLSIALIVATGVFTRYVKPSLLPWLVLTAALLIGLALVAIVGDVRHGGGDHEDGHSHRSGVVWLLAVPIVVLIFVTPPALRPQAATRSATNVSNDVLRVAFPPLPPGRAPDVSLAEAVVRAANDSTGSLDNRLITVTGFALNEPGGIDLARIVIICCAADAQLARIHLRDRDGASTFHFPGNTWLRVEGVVIPAERQPHTPPIPTLRAVSVTPVDAPANPYG